MSSATGAPVFSHSLCSFLSWSSFKKMAVRFMTTKYHMYAYVSIGHKYQATRRTTYPWLRYWAGIASSEAEFRDTKRHGIRHGVKCTPHLLTHAPLSMSSTSA
jgi:hypothetical protein